jgi:hypothetical protein
MGGATAPLKNMSIGATAPCRSRLGYGSKFFITFGGPQAHGHSVEEHVEKITGYFRFLPGAARLRSLFFITLGGPQGPWALPASLGRIFPLSIRCCVCHRCELCGDYMVLLGAQAGSKRRVEVKHLFAISERC